MPADHIDFRILGPVTAEREGIPVQLGPTRQRAVLAYLLLHANRVVSRDRLLEALWDEVAPETAATALHGYVSGLRKILGADRIETRPPGYAIQVGDGELDLLEFELLVRRARILEPAEAADELHRALSLWQGEPLADLDSVPFRDAEAERLEELHLGALEERIDADLILGRHTELTGELDSLVRTNPLRDRIRGQLMLALYRSGRQAEALDTYRQGRELLQRELGLEPGEALKRLERSILEHDPGLGEPDPPEPMAIRTDRGAAASWRDRRTVIVLAVALVAGTAGIAFALTRGDGASLTAAPNSVAVIEPGSGRLSGVIPAGRRPIAVAVGEGSVWVANAGDHTVQRIDPKTKEVTATFGLGSDVSDVAVGLGSVWVADGNDGTVTRIDPAVNAIQETLDLGRTDALSPAPVFWVATGAGAVWAIKGTQLLRIDPATSIATARLRVPLPGGLAADSQWVWVVTQDQRLLRISPDGKRVTGELPLPEQGGSPLAAGEKVWLVVNIGPGEIWRIDANSLTQEASGRTEGFPIDLASAGGPIWASTFSGNVVRLDAETLDVVSSTPLGTSTPGDLAVGEGSVWVSVGPVANGG